MAQYLLPRERQESTWDRVESKLAATFRPEVYMAMRNAENTQPRIAGNEALQEHRQAFYMKALQLQYLQHQDNQQFQGEMTQLSHQRQRELAEFRAQVDLAIQEKDLVFQRWSLQQQKTLQLELKGLEAGLARELRAYDRETQLNLIQERKKLDNSPIWLVADQIINSQAEQEPIPLRLFFAPPTLPHDPKSAEISGHFPQMSDYLASELEKFLSKYMATGRPTQFLYGAWSSTFFRGPAAVVSLFDTLKSEPTLVLESSVEGEYFNLRFGFWGINWATYRYQSAISSLSWREVMNESAKARALRWNAKRESWLASGKKLNHFYKRYGQEPVKRYIENLEIVERERECIAEGDDLDEIERLYHWHKSDYKQLRHFMATCHCLMAGLFADEYFLVHVPPHIRVPPLLPELLPDLLQGIPQQQVDALVDLVASFYQHLYQYIGQEESCWLPELLLDLADSLSKLHSKKWARQQIMHSVHQWLKLHDLPQPAGLEPSFKEMLAELTISDMPYLEKLNHCLATLNDREQRITQKLIEIIKQKEKKRRRKEERKREQERQKYKVENFICINTLKLDYDEAKEQVISRDGKTLLTWGDKTIKIWQLHSGQLVGTLFDDSVNRLAISPDSKTVVSSNEQTIKIWQLESGQHLHTLYDSVDKLTISPDSKTLVNGSWKGTIKIWHLHTGQLLRTISAHSSVKVMVMSPDGKTLVSAGWHDETIKIWQFDTGQLLSTLSESAKALVISRDSKILVSAGWDGTIKIWQLETGQLLRTVSANSESIEVLIISPDGKTLVSGDEDGTIKIWQLDTGLLLRTFSVHSSANGLLMSRDGKSLVSSGRSENETVKIWQLHSGQLLRTLSESIEARLISSDGKTLITAYNDSNESSWLQIWRVP